MNKILAYGTLRKGDYNFDRIVQAFGEGSIVKLGETAVANFKMFDLGFYPCVRQSESSEDQILCDILEVNDKAYEFISAMERGAGYDETTVNLEGQDHIIYTYRREPNAKVIKTGDWFNRS